MELIQIENSLLNILNHERITEENANKFKDGLKQIKSEMGLNLSKQYFLNLIARENKNHTNLRLNRIIKKAEIKTNTGFYYCSVLTSSKGNLYKQKSRKTINFFIV